MESRHVSRRAVISPSRACVPRIPALVSMWTPAQTARPPDPQTKSRLHRSTCHVISQPWPASTHRPRYRGYRGGDKHTARSVGHDPAAEDRVTAGSPIPRWTGVITRRRNVKCEAKRHDAWPSGQVLSPSHCSSFGAGLCGRRIGATEISLQHPEIQNILRLTTPACQLGSSGGLGVTDRDAWSSISDEL